jgi:hypothetical protein
MTQPNKRNARIKLLLMMALCSSPVIASWALYVARVPLGQKSVGELLPTQPFSAAASAAWPRGKWVLASVTRDGCDEACRQHLFAQRQIQTAQGEDASRLQRVLLSNSSATKPEGTVLVSMAADSLPQRGNGLYLIDPLGNQVMFYPDRADPTKVIREVGRILKTNNGLG